MSQVKKLQQGGSLTIDGIRYDATPELINQLSQYLSSYGNTSAPIAGLISDLQAGANVNYNSVGNRISGLTQERSGVDQETFNKRASTEKRSRLATILDNDQVQFDKAVNLLKGFRYFDPKSAAQNNTSKQTDIFGNRLFYKYGEAGENGKRKLVADSPENSLISSRLNTFADWLSADENGRKNYKLDSWYNPTNLAAINALYGQYGNNSDAWKARLQQIATNATNDSLTESDLALLKAFNIVKDNEDNTGTSNKSQSSQSDWNKYGFGDFYKDYGNKGKFNINGGLEWGDEDIPDWWNTNWKNMEFNESFFKNNPAFNPYKNFLLNKTYYNGALYAPSNEYLRAELNKPGGYNELIANNKWFGEGGANELVQTLYGNDIHDKNPDFFPSYAYSNFFDGKNYGYYNLTGAFKPTGDYKNFGDGYQLVQYVDYDNPIENPNDPYRRYKIKFAVLDKHGNVVSQNGNPLIDLTSNDVERIKGGKSADNLFAHTNITDVTQESPYYGYYYDDITTSNGPTDWRIYSPKSGNGKVIINMPDIKSAGADDSSEAVLVPKEVTDVLFNDQNWEKILSDPRLQDSLQHLLSYALQSRTQQVLTENGSAWLPYESDLQRVAYELQLTPEQIQRIKDWFAEVDGGKTNYDTRQLRHKVRRYMGTNPLLKEANGGVIKNQIGGVAGGSVGVRPVSERRINTQYNDARNAAALTDIGSKKWTSADSLELGALAADLASLGFAFAPGANVGSAVAGFGSSIARYTADSQRNNASLGNLALNLGMDAATLIPFAGGAVKGWKVVKAAKRALPTLLKFAALYGASDAFTQVLGKIGSGESLTVRDISTLVNGVTAGIAIKKNGANPFKRQAKVADNIELTGTKSGKTLKLSGKEVENIKNPKALEDTLFEKAKTELNNPNLTREEFAADFNVENLTKTKYKAGKLSLNPKKWISKEATFEPKMVRPGMRNEDIVWNEFNRGKQTKKVKQTVTVQHNPIKDTYKPLSFNWKGKEISFTPEEIAILKKGYFTKEGKAILTSKLPKGASMGDVKELAAKFSKQKPTRNWIDNISETIVGKLPDSKKFGKPTETRTSTKGKIPINKYTETIERELEIPRFGMALPQIIRHPNRVDGQRPVDFLEDPRYYKKGGVVKAQNSTPGGLRSGLDLSGLDLTFTNKKKDNSLFGFNTTIGTGTNFGSYVIADKDGKVRRIDNKPIGSLDFTPEPYSGLVQNPTSVIQNDTNTEQGNTVSEFQKEKDWTPAINTLNYLKTKNDVKTTVDNITSVPAYTMQGYNPSSPRFVLSGLGNQYRNAANRMKLIKQVTSDQNIANADIRQRMAQVNDYYLKGAMQDSKEWSAYQTGLSDFANKVYGKNWDIAAQNGYSWNSKLMLDAQARNAGISEISKHRNKWVYSTLDQYNRERLNRDRTNALKYDFDVFSVTRSKLNNKTNDLLAEFGGDTENPGYKFTMENLRRQAENLQLQTMNNMSLFKSGGKVSKSSGGKNSKVTYSRDPYPDLLLQESKNSDKKVEKINDAIIKLILQTKPIHVS